MTELDQQDYQYIQSLRDRLRWGSRLPIDEIENLFTSGFLVRIINQPQTELKLFQIYEMMFYFSRRVL